jgi:uncharacterized protein (DUF1919 family)
MLKKIYNRLSNFIWNLNRKKINKHNHKKVSDSNIPTIISCNCTGGVMYHDLGWQFMSPTINLYMNCADYVKFCENLDYYLSIKLSPCPDTDREYPVALLDDLKVYMVHYKTFTEAEQKWEERKKRVDMQNIRIIATDRDGCTEELKVRFSKLPYKKVMFTHLHDNFDSSFYIKGFENEEQVGTVVSHQGDFSGKRYYDQFDWINFLKEN